MDRRKKRKTVGKEAPVAAHSVPCPGSGALEVPGGQKLAQEGQVASGGEGLPFRVDLPSRRWLEQAANSAAAGR